MKARYLFPDDYIPLPITFLNIRLSSALLIVIFGCFGFQFAKIMRNIQTANFFVGKMKIQKLPEG